MRSVAADAYSGEITPRWFGPPGPNGGFIAALILRAMGAEVADPARKPRSLTLHYLRPPAEGQVRIDVTLERSGRTATTCSARMSQGDRLLTLAICVLTTDYEATVEWQPEPPDVPESSRPMQEVAFDGAPEIFRMLEFEPLFGPPPFSGGSEAVTGGWLRTRAGDELSPELIALFADAWWPAPFSVLEQPLAAPTLELTIHFRADPEPGEKLALVRFRSEAAIGGTFDEAGEVWGRDGRLLAQSRQVALLRPWPSP